MPRPRRVRRGCAEGVGDGVEERAHKGLGLGQPQRLGALDGRGMGLVRHGCGDGAQLCDVVRVEGSCAPRVVVGGVRPGRRRPRPTRCRACRAAAPQQAAAGWAPGVWRARTSRGRASVTGSRTAGTVRARAPAPCGRTTVSGVAPGRSVPSGCQNATLLSRGRGAGRNTAAAATVMPLWSICSVMAGLLSLVGRHGYALVGAACVALVRRDRRRLRPYGRGLTIKAGRPSRTACTVRTTARARSPGPTDGSLGENRTVAWVTCCWSGTARPSGPCPGDTRAGPTSR